MNKNKSNELSKEPFDLIVDIETSEGVKKIYLYNVVCKYTKPSLGVSDKFDWSFDGAFWYVEGVKDVKQLREPPDTFMNDNEWQIVSAIKYSFFNQYGIPK